MVVGAVLTAVTGILSGVFLRFAFPKIKPDDNYDTGEDYSDDRPHRKDKVSDEEADEALDESLSDDEEMK